MSDRLPDIQTKLDQSDEIDKTAASFMKTSLNDYSMYEVDEKHNTTCPPDLMGFDVVSLYFAYLVDNLLLFYAYFRTFYGILPHKTRIYANNSAVAWNLR